ncbi:MAG: TIGR02281 family clan AA aspartic protease [Candidatus Polarisedimenticolaceae bacterium]|nr:TIGR02281 family clan AA aspartic protease [Candidatus Polarisedimenticolaceae bacterium]
MCRHSAALLLLSLLLLSTPMSAFESIQVMALFSGKAMVMIDGKQRMLSVGVPSPEGVLLVTANSRGAVLEIDGKQQNYQLGSRISTQYKQRESAPEAKIWRSGHRYLTSGLINGLPVRFLVDTGATSVAMSSVAAKRLGIPYKLRGRRVGVSTASGHAKGYAIKLDRVKVGEIELYNVGATVIEGSSPTEILLGMTFLKQVTMDDRGELLVLRKRF